MRVQLVALAFVLAPLPAAGQSTPQASKPTHLAIPVNDWPWRAMDSTAGQRGGEIAFLRTPAKGGPTELAFRVPPGFRAPRHWHSANETNVVLQGTFNVQMDDGSRASLGPGGYSYIPRYMIHEAWCGDGATCVVFTTVDGAWDVYAATDTLPPTGSGKRPNRPQ